MIDEPSRDNRRALRLIRYTHGLKNIVEAVAIVAAGCWAFYVFIYTDRIKPLQDPPTINLTHETLVGRRLPNGNIPVIDRITLHNVGQIRVSIFGITYRTNGRTTIPQLSNKPREAGHQSSWNADEQMSRDVLIKMTTRAWGHSQYDNYYYLEPGESEAQDFVTIVGAKHNFAFASMRFSVLYTKRGFVGLEAPFRRGADGFLDFDTSSQAACAARGVIDETAECPFGTSELTYLVQLPQ